MSASALALPDGRAYELVSPPEDSEVHLPPYAFTEREGSAGGFVSTVAAYRAALDGDALTYVGDPPASGVTGAGREIYSDLHVATRAAKGWEASDIEPAGNSEEAPEAQQVFSPDLSVFTEHASPLGLVDLGLAEPQPTPDCANKLYNIYSHDASGYHALITEKQVQGECYANGAAGISANDAHILLYSPYPYTSGAKEDAEEGNNLYDSVGGVLHQVNLLPDGEPEQHPNAFFGDMAGESQSAAERYNFNGDISTDGSRVFWTDLNTEVTAEDPAGTTRLFVRENDSQPQSPVSSGVCTVAADACTVQVDATQGSSGTSGDGKYWTASSDGARVFFTDCNRLTEDSTASPEASCEHEGEINERVFTGNDLYEYDLNKPLGQRLTDLTVDHHAGDSLGADVQGVIGASEGGSYVYFVANGALTEGKNAEGTAPESGQPNLYLSHAGTTSFIATLSAKDDSFNISARGETGVYSGDWRVEPGGRTAEVAAGGHAVVFMSQLALTGYENTGCELGEVRQTTCPEVFVYEADSDRVTCASCSSGGVRPTPNTVYNWEYQRGGYVSTTASPLFQSRFVNAAGTQVFFMSAQPLVPQDTNHYQDVYEWDSDGSGGCQQATGCVAPLSSISTPASAWFIDASANGEDAFFAQRASLVPSAADEGVKIYDARVDGGFLEPSLACTGAGCQGVPPAPPIFATPSSVTFDGVGNFEAPATAKSVTPKRKTPAQVRAGKLAKALKACRARPKKRRAACERQARRKYAPESKKGKR